MVAAHWRRAPQAATVRATEPTIVVAPLASIPIESEDPSEYGRCDCTRAADGARNKHEATTLTMACESFSAPECNARFEVFADLHDAVVVKRDTGGCGGCGALTVAAVFHADAMVAHAMLGRYGRFGNGPDAVHWTRIGGTRALVVDSSESMGGYSAAYIELFWVSGGAIQPGHCLQVDYSNDGAREAPDVWQWRATPTFHTSGALDVQYRVTDRGANAPKTIPPLHMTADRVRSLVDPKTDWNCAAPEWSDERHEPASAAKGW